MGGKLFIVLRNVPIEAWNTTTLLFRRRYVVSTTPLPESCGRNMCRLEGLRRLRYMMYICTWISYIFLGIVASRIPHIEKTPKYAVHIRCQSWRAYYLTKAFGTPYVWILMYIDVQFQFFIRTERTRAGVNPHSSSPSVLHISFRSYSFLFLKLMHIYLDGIGGYFTFLTEFIQVFDGQVIEYIDSRLHFFLSIFKMMYELQLHRLSFFSHLPIPFYDSHCRRIASIGFTPASRTPYDTSIITVLAYPKVFVNHPRPSSAFTSFQALQPINGLTYSFALEFHFSTHSLKVNPVRIYPQSTHPTNGA